MNSSLKKLVVALLVILYVMTGFFREFVFLNINEQSRVTYYHDTDSHVAPAMQWLSGMSYTTLYYAKWPLTLLFAAGFAFLASRIVKLAYNEKAFVRSTWIIYGITFLLGFLFYVCGALFHASEETYDIARFLAGLTETPAMLAILMAAFYAWKKRPFGTAP